MSSIRINFHVVIGIEAKTFDDHFIDQICLDLDERLTRLTGGITRFTGEGTWTPASQQERFDGPLERDTSINYMISVPSSREDTTLKGMRRQICDVVRRYELPVRYVHVSRTIAEERIFSIEQPENSENSQAVLESSCITQLR